MHLKTKKKKKKITTAGSDSWLPCSSAAAHALHGSRGGCRQPARSTSGGKRAATRVPSSPRASRQRPVPLAATNQLVLHERERRASKYCDPISPRASDENE